MSYLTQVNKGVTECRYERLVECHNRDKCLHCGWNPYESYERRKKLRKEFEQEEEVLLE